MMLLVLYKKMLQRMSTAHIKPRTYPGYDNLTVSSFIVLELTIMLAELLLKYSILSCVMIF